MARLSEVRAHGPAVLRARWELRHVTRLGVWAVAAWLFYESFASLALSGPRLPVPTLRIT